jgi:uncharacterized protein (TIGR02231 family)
MSKRAALALALAGMIVFVVLAIQPMAANPPLAAKENVPAPPANGARTAASRVVAVTVYPNSALVAREVDVPEGQGPLELVVTPLPPQIVNSSLYTEGTDGVRVLTTRFRTRQLMEDTREDVRKLQDELKQLELAREKLDADSKAIQANLQHLGKLENYTNSTTAHAGDKGNLNSESAIALSKYVMESRLEKSRELITLQQQVRLNQEKAEFAQRQLRELAAGASRTERDAVIVVDRVNGAAGKVRLHYLVDAAAWRPQYKFKAGKTAAAPVQLEYLAAVVQQTGESWDDVKLVLSTAQPMLNAAPPDLHILQVAVQPRGHSSPARTQALADLQEQVKNLRSQAQKEFNERKQTSADGLCNTAAALDQSFELLNPLALAARRECAPGARQGPSVTYVPLPEMFAVLAV